MNTVSASRVYPVSQLLQDHAESQELIAAGDMVPDGFVLLALLEKLLDPAYGGLGGCTLVVDGFPRTTLQVDLVWLLYEKLMEVHRARSQSMTHRGIKLPHPRFKTVILYVDEATSLQRQLSRGAEAEAADCIARDTGLGGSTSVRATDTDIAKARHRYQIFKQHANALVRLKQLFPYHVISSMGTLSEVQQEIKKELR
eukprot:2195098-Pyramimonas_sp.AAC.1